MGICSIYSGDATNPPNAREPVSPMNTLAGYTLNSRKPRSAPTTAHVIGEMPLLVPIATTVKNVATSTVTLEARPSRPSVKFKPFKVPITAMNMTGTASPVSYTHLDVYKRQRSTFFLFGYTKSIWYVGKIHYTSCSKKILSDDGVHFYFRSTAPSRHKI